MTSDSFAAVMEAAKRRHVGVDPHRAIGDLCPSGPGEGTKPGLGGYELFGLHGELGKVRGERRVIDRGVGERLASAGARRNFAGEVPVDSGRHVGPNYCCFLG